VVQTSLSLEAFAVGMRRDCPGFAQRVHRFEERFGPVDANILGVLAQAAFFCWFENEYEQDFIEVCRAIGQGKPTTMYLCCQITPQRWATINSYAVGMQCWLGAKLPLPGDTEQTKIDWVAHLLGPRHPAKEALVVLTLHWLVSELRDKTILGRLAGADTKPKQAEYADYSAWYASFDGQPLSCDLSKAKAACKDRVLAGGSMPPAASEALVDGITRECQPPCHFRYSRYLDIKLASIGALLWRGQLPPDEDYPRTKAAGFLDAAAAAVREWADGKPAIDNMGKRIQFALGEANDRKVAMAREFFLQPKDDLGTQFWDWMLQSAGRVG
jgi:hypothetical protein